MFLLWFARRSGSSLCHPDETMTSTSAAPHRVVIVSFGFGGLGLIAVTLISGANHYLFLPLLYRVAISLHRGLPKRRVMFSGGRTWRPEVTRFNLKARRVSAVQPWGRSGKLRC